MEVDGGMFSGEAGGAKGTTSLWHWAGLLKGEGAQGPTEDNRETDVED